MAPEKCRGSNAIILKWSETEFQGRHRKGICPACGKAVETYGNSQALPAAKDHGTD